MERLTFEGNFCDIAQCREQPCPYNGSCSQREVWERLKAYEDKGCEPEEVLPKEKAGEIAMAEYIEREAVKERFAKRLDWIKKDIHDEYSGALCDGCETDMELIDEIPAADVVPVVHARWIDDGSGIIICSECKRGYNLVPGFTHYCPNCGAKMDGGDGQA